MGRRLRGIARLLVEHAAQLQHRPQDGIAEAHRQRLVIHQQVDQVFDAEDGGGEGDRPALMAVARRLHAQRSQPRLLRVPVRRQDEGARALQ
ncbi:MAG TPA: hypothetical protein PLZ36_07095, partial [Armatimonadota bacterium]|nr:hypothetical protein [Armatimonadota bacterium]